MKTKLVIATLAFAFASQSLGMESSAKISESTAEEVEMEMSADKEIIVRNAQPDARLYILSGGTVVTPNMQKAFEVLKSEEPNSNKSGYELALEIFSKK